MKQFTLTVLLILCFQTSMLWGQLAPANYSATHDLSKSFIEYNLVLEDDNTFNFHFYRKIDCEQCVEENKYGKGTWRIEGKSLLLTSNAETDINEEFVLNLSNSKARLIHKRNYEGQKVMLLKFYESDIFWVKGMELQPD